VDCLIVIASCVDVIVSNLTAVTTGVIVFRVIRLIRLFPVLGKRVCPLIASLPLIDLLVSVDQAIASGD
jgi:hypothetical protein